MFRIPVALVLLWSAVACSPQRPEPLLSVWPGGGIDASLAEPPDAHHRAALAEDHGAAQGNVSTTGVAAVDQAPGSSRPVIEAEGSSRESSASTSYSGGSFSDFSDEPTDTNPYAETRSRSPTGVYGTGMHEPGMPASRNYGGSAWDQWSTTTPYGGSSYADRPHGW